MDSSNEYTVEYKFTSDVSGLKKGVQEVKNTIESAKNVASGFGEQLSEGFYQAVGSINDLDGKTQALLASITALEVAFAKSSLDAFSQYEDAMYGMAVTVSNVGGTIGEAMAAIQESTANGLLSETDAARAINNLTSYGYSVQEATRLIQELTNVAMANRNETVSVSEQVENLTEGIKRGSSQMLKANGLMVTASEASAVYAASIGKTASELGKEEQMQALANAAIQQGQANASVATAYQETYSAATQRLTNSIQDLKVAFGQAIAPLMTWIANAAAWLAQNKQLVVGMATFVGVLVGSGGVFVALAKLIPAIRSAVAWFNALSAAGKGLVGILAAVATTAAIAATVAAINSMSTGLENVSAASADASDGMDDFTQAVGGGGGGGATGAVRDLSKELAKLEREYLDELKQIETRHKETIDRLTKQIQDANVDYRRAIDERNAEFAVSQAKEEKKHQEKVDELMTQIDFLQRYNNEYNRQKLTNLQLALARENHLYQEQTKAAKAELELQNENDRMAYEEKRAQLQSELDDELAFMNKHRDELRAVQDWIIEDEIEALNRRYEEQKESYAMQAEQASIGGATIGTNMGENINKALKQQLDNIKPELELSANSLGNVFGDTFVGKAFAITDEFFNGMLKTVQDILGWVVDRAKEIYNTTKSSYEYQKARQAAGGGGGGDGWAMGGFTGRGGVNEVAGVVHKGEYVLPQEMVDQNTGLPKSMGTTVININLSGTFATSAAERRKVADQIVAAINQNNKSRLEASWQ